MVKVGRKNIETLHFQMLKINKVVNKVCEEIFYKKNNLN